MTATASLFQTQPKPNKAKWRSPQLLMQVSLVLLIATALGWQLVRTYQHETELSKRVISMGGVVTIGNSTSQYPQSRLNFWRFVRGFRVRGISLAQRPVSDDDIYKLGDLKHVDSLILAGTCVTSDSLQAISQMGKLSQLDLSDTNVDNAGLKHLRAHESLEFLNINQTKISDRGVSNLSRNSVLKVVCAIGSKVTERSVERLGPQTNVVIASKKILGNEAKTIPVAVYEQSHGAI